VLAAAFFRGRAFFIIVLRAPSGNGEPFGVGREPPDPLLSVGPPVLDALG